ncbi:hypothetical protein HY374_02055 [Candidatus Berkelbacteria bacterium]|nr:hypothetical protein [Candidatus Berkelbacteria bacterium]
MALRRLIVGVLAALVVGGGAMLVYTQTRPSADTISESGETSVCIDPSQEIEAPLIVDLLPSINDDGVFQAQDEAALDAALPGWREYGITAGTDFLVLDFLINQSAALSLNSQIGPSEVIDDIIDEAERAGKLQATVLVRKITPNEGSPAEIVGRITSDTPLPLPGLSPDEAQQYQVILANLLEPSIYSLDLLATDTCGQSVPITKPVLPVLAEGAAL